MKKVIAILLIIFVLILVSVCAKYFLIGTPINIDSLAIQVEEADGQISIYIQTTDSAVAISKIQYQYNGTVMHLIPWGVLVSPIYDDGDKCLYYEIIDETEIWVGNKLIWSA